MITYVAFLRAINVAGQKLIKMSELVRILSEAGFRNVRTYIQSGNVLFDSASASSAAITRKLESALESALGYKVTVMLRTLPELKALIKRDPFKQAKTSPDEMLFVVFLAEDPRTKLKLPLNSEKESLHVIAVKDRAAFVIARRKPDGRSSFPNAFIEKALGVSATTRNWNTINKIAELPKKNSNRAFT